MERRDVPNLLLPEEETLWSEYESRDWVGTPPDRTNAEHVAAFRHFLNYQKLVRENDPCVASIPEGSLILVHPEYGILNFAVDTKMFRRQAPNGGCMFLHEPRRSCD
jgi:hypothetical protein